MSATHPHQLKRMRTVTDETVAPKYAHLERERRWLVQADAAPVGDDPIAIVDRYIVGTRLRLREMRRGDDVVWKLTKKYECVDSLARPIVTTYLTLQENDVLAALPALMLSKHRYRFNEGGHLFSLDRFDGPLAGLVLAEIEVMDDAALRAIADPAWTIRDVSDDARYQGATLAANGSPEEK